MQVVDLTPEHIGRSAIVLGRQGTLIRAQVPGYARTVTAWYLITPSPLPQFEEEAVSLQWATDAEVTLVDACRNCSGTGRVADTVCAAITHRSRTVQRKCRYCKGTGQFTPVTPPTEDNTELSEIPDWMLGIDNEPIYDLGNAGPATVA